eukprot:12940814-Ditylum_brightwellii.AAC.1
MPDLQGNQDLTVHVVCENIPKHMCNAKHCIQNDSIRSVVLQGLVSDSHQVPDGGSIPINDGDNWHMFPPLCWYFDPLLSDEVSLDV